MTPRARQIIREVAAACGVAPQKVVSRCKTDPVVRARIEVARRLTGFGYSSSRIGQILNRDHTTILFYLATGKKKPVPPRWKKPVVRHLEWLSPVEILVPPPPPPGKRYLMPYAGAYWPEYEWKQRA